MKKREPRKLTLHRETLQSLGAAPLARAGGGYRTENTCDVSGCIECLPVSVADCYPGWT